MNSQHIMALIVVFSSMALSEQTVNKISDRLENFIENFFLHFDNQSIDSDENSSQKLDVTRLSADSLFADNQTIDHLSVTNENSTLYYKKSNSSIITEESLSPTTTSTTQSRDTKLSFGDFEDRSLKIDRKTVSFDGSSTENFTQTTESNKISKFNESENEFFSESRNINISSSEMLRNSSNASLFDEVVDAVNAKELNTTFNSSPTINATNVSIFLVFILTFTKFYTNV